MNGVYLWAFFFFAIFLLDFKALRNIYRRVSIVVLNQFLRVSRKFENNRYTPLAQVRILSWDFFPLYFFYSFYQILIRSWDVELHTKFQPHKFFFCNTNGARLNFGYSNQNWHVADCLIGPPRVHNCNNLIYFSL
jgi:hypothetical protein